MQGQFVDLYASADYLGPGAIEIDRYQTEIFRHRAPAGRVWTEDQAGAGDRASVAVL